MVEQTEIEFYTSPWVSGRHAASYFGNLNLSVFVPDEPRSSRGERTDSGFRCLISLSKSRIEHAGGNALVGVEFYADPFAEFPARHGTRLTLIGTIARLVQ